MRHSAGLEFTPVLKQTGDVDLQDNAACSPERLPLNRTKNRRSFSPAQMLKRHRSRCRGPAAYWSGGTGS
jgi:hypothetical protein